MFFTDPYTKTLLDCFIPLGFSPADKRTFIHRAFTIPKLKKAAHKTVDFESVQQFALDNYDLPGLDEFNYWL